MAKIIDDSNPNYHLGNKQMDKTHMEFISIVNKIANADKAEFRELFSTLVTHTEAHFDAENREMENSHFPAIHEHVAEHARVMRDLNSFKAMVTRGTTSMARSFIRDQIPEWFHLHATTMDSALATHLKSLEQEQSNPDSSKSQSETFA